MSKEEKEVSMVKIDSDLYKDVTEMVVANQIDFPSIKNFIELAVRSYINSIKYNIENRDEIISRKGELIFKQREKGFVPCILCDKVFLDKRSKTKEEIRICPRCKDIVLNLAQRIK